MRSELIFNARDRVRNPYLLCQLVRISSRRVHRSGEGMPEMNDPNSTRFGYGFRRRYGMQEIQPAREATETEELRMLRNA